jgi:hypothetical protein
VRALLALLVGLAQVAGPWLCPCVSACAASPVARPATPPAEVCPHCKSELPEPPAKSPPGLPDPCPCGGKATAEPVVPAKPESLDPFAFDPPAAPIFFAAVPVPLVAHPPAAGVIDLPFLPPGARLFVHHVLRC